MKHSRFRNRATAIRAVVVAGVLAGFTTFAAWPGATAQAQSGCAAATTGAAADADQQAYVDVGVANKATFVCVTSTAFTGGQSAPITANGTIANGCFIVEGLNTSVVVVYRDWSVTSMNCAQLVRIDVGTGLVATPTATATATTPAATATPTKTPTSPPATATQPPATATPPAATATPTKPAVVPAPPKTGTGSAGSDSGFPLIGAGFLVLVIGLAGATGLTAGRKGNRG